MTTTTASREFRHERLSATRRKRGLTQLQVAIAVGVTTRTVKRWERGVADPSLENALALAKALGVTVNYLTGRGGEHH
jgi:transcriptional regulator with XRE-family HTH domain